MKRIVWMMLAATLAFTAAGHAKLAVIGKGDAMQLEIGSFPNKMKERYLLMKVKCAKCHSLERTIRAVNTGIAPISGQLFDRSATRAYGIKMLRKPDAKMSKEETKEIVELLNFLIEEAEK